MEPSEEERWAGSLVGVELAGGRYRLDQVLGVGSMGAVYRGVQVRIDRPVAIKVLLPALRDAREATERFHREAVAAARIARRGVVGVLDFDEDPEHGPFLVMELLRGGSLADLLLRQGPLPWQQAATVGCSLLDTLAAVHDAGIVHRDLKPDNVVITDDERGMRVVVVDFGISHLCMHQQRRVTRTGAVMGTPEYMAPEQARGRAVTVRSDLYAEGALLYECVTGRPPFEGDSWPEVYSKVLTEPHRPLREVLPELPEAFCALVDQALAKDPGERPASAGEMAEALREVLGAAGEEVPPRPSLEPLRPSDRALLAVAPTQRTPPAPDAGFEASVGASPARTSGGPGPTTWPRGRTLGLLGVLLTGAVAVVLATGRGEGASRDEASRTATPTASDASPKPAPESARSAAPPAVVVSTPVSTTPDASPRRSDGGREASVPVADAASPVPRRSRVRPGPARLRRRAPEREMVPSARQALRALRALKAPPPVRDQAELAATLSRLEGRLSRALAPLRTDLSASAEPEQRQCSLYGLAYGYEHMGTVLSEWADAQRKASEAPDGGPPPRFAERIERLASEYYDRAVAHYDEAILMGPLDAACYPAARARCANLRRAGHGD